MILLLLDLRIILVRYGGMYILMEKMDRKNNKHKNLGPPPPMLPKLGLRYPNLRRNNKMMIIDVIIYNLYAEN